MKTCRKHAAAFMALAVAVGLMPAAAFAAERPAGVEVSRVVVQSASISSAKVTVTAPAVGAKSAATKPRVTLPSGAHYAVESSGWYAESGEYADNPSFTFKAGKTYKFWVTLKAKSGYFFSDNASASITGGTRVGSVDVYTYGDYSAMMVAVSVKAAGASSTKAANTLSVVGKTATLKASALKKANKTLARSKILTVSKAKGTVTYAKQSGNKKIAVNAKTGKVTVKKGLGAGTYRVKVKVKAAGNTSFKPATKAATFTVKVKK